MARSGMQIHIDDEQLHTLHLDLREAPKRLQFNAPRVLREKVGPKLDREMAEDARGHRHLPHLPRSVSHEMLDRWTVEAGLGPIPGTQGRLAHIIVYGSVNNAPVYDHMAGPRRAMPQVLAWLADAAETSVFDEVQEK